MHGLPDKLYRAKQVRELERTAIEGLGVSGLRLMERAGTAAYHLLRRCWPRARRIVVVCGTGNNGGDGYVLARLALEAGLETTVLYVGDLEKLQGDALTVCRQLQLANVTVQSFSTRQLAGQDVIVDALLGTGLHGVVTGVWAAAITAINVTRKPVLSIDIPSGLDADSGQVLGVAVRAHTTISFIGLKQGLLTADGPDYCGAVVFDDLAVPEAVYRAVPVETRRIDYDLLKKMLMPRSRSAHKGRFGHVLIIGGNYGMAGAVRLAAEAAGRSGAGLVTVATRPEHVAAMVAGYPEIMCHGIIDVADVLPLLAKATVVVIGPGLGQDDWARALLGKTLESQQHLLVDADALNLLAEEPVARGNWVLTPHPGEAARLLGQDKKTVQNNRFQSVLALAQRYGGTAVLKGAGTLVQEAAGSEVLLCSDGNPGMATGGMGDVLSGIIAALLAQGFRPIDAAALGVCVHARAGDLAAKEGERGLQASDLSLHLRFLLNPAAGAC